MKVFLVEDCLPIRERIRALVEETGGMVVGEATTEDEAVVGLAICKPQLVIIDLTLEEGSGLAVLRQVKRAQPSIIAVVLTGHNTEQYQRVCMASGADFFMAKATDYAVLVELLERLQCVVNETVKDIKREA